MNLETFILIGGRSTRFGRDKVSVSINGKSLAERTAETVKDAISPTRMTLVAANETQLVSLAGIDLSLPFVFDVYEGRGATAGLHAALANARSEWILVLACDLPLVSSEFLTVLTESISDDFDAVAPIQPDGKIQPLCAIYRVKPCLEIVENRLLSNHPTLSLRSIFDGVRTRFLAVEEYVDLAGAENFFLNMNAPEDFQRATEILQRVAPAK